MGEVISINRKQERIQFLRKLTKLRLKSLLLSRMKQLQISRRKTSTTSESPLRPLKTSERHNPKLRGALIDSFVKGLNDHIASLNLQPQPHEKHPAKK